MVFMKKASRKTPRTLVIKALPPGINGRSLSAAKRAVIVKKVQATMTVKSISRLEVKDSATGRVSFRGLKSAGGRFAQR